MEQLAKDLHALLSGAVTSAKVYERDAPRDDGGAVVGLPFVVYTADPRSASTELDGATLDLFVDVWALDSFKNCYSIMAELDSALNGTVHELTSGAVCCDRNGLVFQRGERDPEDERIRRMSGQYLISFNPDFKE